MREPIPETNRRQALGMIASACLAGSSFAASAQVLRTAGPIRIVVPWPPGGGSDLIARLIATAMGERGLQAIVENRPGATGTVGAEHVYGSAPNGTTLLLATADSLVIYPHVVKTRFDPLKFVPVVSVGNMPLYLIGRPDLPANSLAEVIALARRQSLSYASPGTGSGPHMTMIDFARVARIESMLHVPYQGAAPLMQAVLSKQVDISIVAASLPVQFRSRIKIFGGTGSSRVAALQDIPTFTEQGLPLVIEPSAGFFAPPGTPPEVTAELNRVISEIAQTPSYKAKLVELAMTAPSGTQAEFDKYIKTEHQKWGEVVRAANVKLE